MLWYQVALALENLKQVSMQNVFGTMQAEVAARDSHELGAETAMIGGAVSNLA
jgi:hypothetical protein